MAELKLSKEAEKILYTAIEGNGQIIRIRTLSGTTIQSGKFSMQLSQLTPREKANWEYGIEELIDYNFINDLGYKKELFAVTKLGYNYYDEHNGESQEEYFIENNKILNNIEIGTKVFDDLGNTYKVISKIDDGGFGRVFKIQNVKNNDFFALKTLINENDLESIENEVILAKEIDNPHVIKYIFLNKHQFNLPPYIIMEYIDGQNLKKVLQKRENLLENNELIDFYKQIVDGMKAINEKVVHRDIKLANIMLTDDNNIKICDFGISKQNGVPTRDLTFKGWGTPEYTAPEGWRMESNTVQMDIYSMGIVFYQLATLEYPYSISLRTEEEYRKAHLSQTPINPTKYNKHLPTYACNMIMKMLEKEPIKRYSSFNEIDTFLNSNEKKEPSNFVQEMLRKRIQYDVEKNKKEIREKEATERKAEETEIIKYSFEQNILNPLKNYIDEFNNAYLNGIVQITGDGRKDIIAYNIISVEEKRTSINIELISNKVFKHKIKNPFFSDSYSSIEKEYYEKEYRPTLNKKEILAWGRISRENGSGINIFLLQDDNNIYGSWFYSVTTNSGLSNQKRIEPICFDFDELEKEIMLFNAMHIYNTELKKMNSIDEICKYIDFCNF